MFTSRFRKVTPFDWYCYYFSKRSTRYPVGCAFLFVCFQRLNIKKNASVNNFADKVRPQCCIIIFWSESTEKGSERSPTILSSQKVRPPTYRIWAVPIRWPRPCAPWSRRRRPACRWARCAGRSWRATRVPAERCRSRTWPRRTVGVRSRASRSCWCCAWTPLRRWCRTPRTRPPGSPKTCEHNRNHHSTGFSLGTQIERNRTRGRRFSFSNRASKCIGWYALLSRAIAQTFESNFSGIDDITNLSIIL